MKKTAVIFSYNDGDLLLSPLKSVLESDIDQVFLLYGGDNVPPEIEKIEDMRLIKVLEKERKGKVSALTSIVPNIGGDIVFLLSGDITFDPLLIKKCEDSFEGTAGVVTVRVVPSNSSHYTEKVASLMWEMHDLQLSYLSGSGKNVHGGEFICARKELLFDIPEVVNEDAYICIRASKADLSVVYLGDDNVRNIVPSNPIDLFQQRRRVNFGHIEIRKIGWDPMIMDTLMFSDTSLFLRIFIKFLKERKWNLLTLSGAISIEIVSNISARMDLLLGKDHKRWTMVKRSNHS